MASKRGMGRGLAAILPESPTDAPGPELRDVPVELIRPNPDQPRSRIDDDGIGDLAASVAAAGIVQPLIVRPLSNGTYELIAGERRWRAAQQAGLDEVPALVRDEEDAERLQVALVENMAREDLNPVDEARACAALVEDLGLSKEELARRLGRSRAAISNLVRLLDLPDEVVDLLRSGELSEGHGRAILLAKGVDARRRLARDAVAGGWSVRETERRAQGRGARRGRSGAPADADRDAALANVADELERALGHDARLRPARNGVKVELLFDDIAELRSFTRRLRRRR
ncbi:MAG TPA: ParB/RepB/Spo0J family partition protein [Solirubrobacterales bacterium]|nr:ParB/RepB/Spo0J family partition protein [Solirubrobacterales bacterium]